MSGMPKGFLLSAGIAWLMLLTIASNVVAESVQLPDKGGSVKIENRQLSKQAQARDPNFRSPAPCSGVDLALTNLEFQAPSNFARATVKNMCSDKMIKGEVCFGATISTLRACYPVSVPGNGTAQTIFIGTQVSPDGRTAACVTASGDRKSSNNCITKRVR